VGLADEVARRRGRREAADDRDELMGSTITITSLGRSAHRSTR